MILASMFGSGEPLFQIEPGDVPGSYRLSGELDIATAPDLESLLREERAAERAVTLDMSELRFIDSRGIRILLMFASSERPLTIVAPSAPVRRVLSVALGGEVPGLIIRDER